jgi:uncharacterized protein YndB with AHSA1/START domain
MEHSVEIARPVDEVFAFLADPANLPRWQSGLHEVRKEGDASGVGARHVEIRSVLGKRLEQTLEVTALEPGRRLDLEVVEGPVHLSIRHTFSSTAGGTRVDVVGEGDPGPLFVIAGPFLARVLKKQSQTDFARLKSELEEADRSR